MAIPKLKTLTGIESARDAWDKIIATTPVVLTVIATILAGLSSSESSMAQYHRALSAQNQSKAADQWGFYQAKRTRQEEADNTIALLSVMAGNKIVEPGWETKLGGIGDAPADPNGCGKYLASGLPTVQDMDLDEPDVISAMKIIAANGDASAILKNKLSQTKIDHALAQAQANADNFDAATKPITAYIDGIVAWGGKLSRSAETEPSQFKSLLGDLTASRLSWDSRRNAAEAKYNQTIAQVLEVDVAYTSLDSDRHRDRSKFFFYGMLAAQAGVTISTLSLAVKKRSLLWAIASLVGMGAVAYAAYIYLVM